MKFHRQQSLAYEARFAKPFKKNSRTVAALFSEE